METIRTYSQLCCGCSGSGEMPNPHFNPNVTGSAQRCHCKVCNGTGLQIVTEKIIDSLSTQSESKLLVN